MQNRTLKVAILAALTVILVLSFAGVALAAPWSDLPDTVTAKYGITDEQVASISEGFPSGLWQPYQSVTRAQFTKMAVEAFKVDKVNPATASYTDVAKGSVFYEYIEGAKAAGMVNGATAFNPNNPITREQALAIIVRYVAKVNGYNLATMYAAGEVDGLLAHFGDKASIGSALKTEVAFAYDMGITVGDAYGNVAPQTNLTRIQGAAMLIRAQEKIPPANWTAAKIELVTADKSENLIGVNKQVTFKVTTADGHPAVGVLVDFDTMFADAYYVGNISPQAAMTNSFGEVTVNLISAEPGTERVSAAVAGVAAIYTTAYWLALDEVYTTGTQSAQNNVGVAHEWGVRVVVFGPGPRSTANTDWYNAISTAVFDPASLKVTDGVDFGDYWSNWWELAIADWTAADESKYDMLVPLGSYKPRTMAGIDVEWSIYNIPDNPLTGVNEAYTSVGNITAVDGVAITAAKTATGKTDANGYSKIKIESTVTGKTYTKAVATYVGNPYPKMLVNHSSQVPDAWHDWDWDPQPAMGWFDLDNDGGVDWNNNYLDEEFFSVATQLKTWISHTLPAQGTPIAPAYSAPNIGEEITLNITLVDTYGNPIKGREVEWFMQGVGFFQTDDGGDRSSVVSADDNVDYDVTDAAGKAQVFVKSYQSGEQIVHAKVRDKGTGGAEGIFQTYTAEVQWFDVDIATFDNPATHTEFNVWDPAANKGKGGLVTVENNEALSSNAVGTSHTFDMWVYGLKLEYAPTQYSGLTNRNQTPFIDSDYTGAAYDGIIDWRDATYFGGILMSGGGFDVQASSSWWDDKLRLFYEIDLSGVKAGELSWATDLDGNGVIESKNSDGEDETGHAMIKVAGRWLTLSMEGAITEYDWDDDGYKESFNGLPGIYIPLEGKTVTFAKANMEFAGKSNLGAFFDGDNKVNGVGSFTPTSAVTDATGKASVTVTSTQKGPETIRGTVDWALNPHNGTQLLTAYAKKYWTAGVVASASDVTIEVWIDGIKVATNKDGELAVPENPVWINNPDPQGEGMVLNSAHVEVHVKDAYGNDLPDYEVVYLLDNVDKWLAGSQGATDTYVADAYLTDLDTSNVLPVNLDPDDDGIDELVGIPYDQNGTRPDSNEPSPADDPYGFIKGAGGTVSFFFNQFLGSEIRFAEGVDGMDGAKAWTLDGYYAPWVTDFVPYVTIDGPTSTTAEAVASVDSDGDITSVTVVDGGSGYLTAPAVHVDSAGTGATFEASISGGVVTSIVVISLPTAMSGYTDPVVLDIDDPPHTHAAAEAFVSGGEVDSISVLTSGAGYVDVPEVTIGKPIDGTTATAHAHVSGGVITSISVDDGGSGYGTSGYGDLEPNLLTGSNIDIQLYEDPFDEGPASEDDHVKSILGIKVYAPADGLVVGGLPIWSTQVHKVWTDRVAKTITLTPALQVKISGDEEATVQGLMVDQYGDPMPNEDVYVHIAEPEAGNGLDVGTPGDSIDLPWDNADWTWDPAGFYFYDPDDDTYEEALPDQTDDNGRFVITYEQFDSWNWGVHVFQAFSQNDGGGVKSNKVTVDWALNDTESEYEGDYSYAEHDGHFVTVFANGFEAWDNLPMTVFLDPAGSTINNGSFWYDLNNDVTINLTHTWPDFDEPYWLHFGSSNTDGAPNWIYNEAQR